MCVWAACGACVLQGPTRQCSMYELIQRYDLELDLTADAIHCRLKEIEERVRRDILTEMKIKEGAANLRRAMTGGSKKSGGVSEVNSLVKRANSRLEELNDELNEIGAYLLMVNGGGGGGGGGGGASVIMPPNNNAPGEPTPSDDGPLGRLALSSGLPRPLPLSVLSTPLPSSRPCSWSLPRSLLPLSVLFTLPFPPTSWPCSWSLPCSVFSHPCSLPAIPVCLT